MPSRFGSPKMPMKRVCLKHQHTLNFSIRTTDHSINNKAWVKKHLKHFKMVLAGHLTDTLPGKGSKILLHHQDCPVHILSLHPLCICLDCLHPYLCFFWKEDKNLDDTNTLLQQWWSLSHSVKIQSNMYDSNFTIRTDTVTSSAAHSGYKPV